MSAAVPRRRTAAAAVGVVAIGVVALGAASLLPWWQQWVDDGVTPATVTSWNLWQASGLASSAVLLAAAGLVLGAWPGAWSAPRWSAPAAGWAAVLLLAGRAVALRPAAGGGGPYTQAVVRDLQGETSGLAPLLTGVGRPDLHVVADGPVRSDLGVGAFLGSCLVLVIALALTLQAWRRPAAAPVAGPAASFRGTGLGPRPVLLGIVVLAGLSLLPWWQQWIAGPDGEPDAVARWNVWQASRLGSAAVLVAGLALLAGLRTRSGAGRPRRLLPVAAAWTAVLLLAVQVFRLSPWFDAAANRVVTLGETQGIEYVRAQAPEVLTLLQQQRPLLLLEDGPVLHAGIGYGGYLAGALVLALAVLLTVRVRRWAPEASRESGGPQESAGPGAG